MGRGPGEHDNAVQSEDSIDTLTDASKESESYGATDDETLSEQTSVRPQVNIDYNSDDGDFDEFVSPGNDGAETKFTLDIDSVDLAKLREDLLSSAATVDREALDMNAILEKKSEFLKSIEELDVFHDPPSPQFRWQKSKLQQSLLEAIVQLEKGFGL